MKIKNICRVAVIMAVLSVSSQVIAIPMTSSEILTGSIYSNANSFQFTNNSSAGENIIKLVWDLTPINGFLISADTLSGTSPKPFTLRFSDDVGVAEPDTCHHA
ncbi:hypothetical protein [Psychromonas hadalis]|uniref:hypothetical protein n=1 Tax=Psychromonas hadalis TaxID=211669 RepID=UPI0003B5A137|nr:hypothetical protein [Psychromonas hadalis]